ncbi:MAG: phosphoribosylanthranilate isomerase [Bernardetiaceae bacterium]|jgi:phosphoribosylanthranilate isomerase|nr:phosphoribosylanthranilate isomerase [Bernardetiaceae bacterium]
MPLSTHVKINAVNNLSTARYAAGMGVAMLGFDLDPASARYVPPARATEIANWLAGVALVGEVHHPAVDLTGYPLTWLQVDNEMLLAELAGAQLPFIYQLRPGTLAELAATEPLMRRLAPQVSYFLLESDALTLSPAVLASLAALAGQFPVMLGFGLAGANVQALLAQLPVAALALPGSPEASPGLPDFTHLAPVLEALETEE